MSVFYRVMTLCGVFHVPHATTSMIWLVTHKEFIVY